MAFDTGTILSTGGSIWGGLSTGAVMAFVALIVVVFVIVIWYWFLSFPVKVILHKVRGGKVQQIIMTVAKPVVDRSTREVKYYSLRAVPGKKMKMVPPPTHDSIYMDFKGRPVLLLTENENGDYIHMKPSGQTAEFLTEERDTKLWFTEMHKEAERVYGDASIWQKYGSLIAVGIIIIGTFIAMMFMLNKMDAIVDGLNAVANSLSNLNIVEPINNTSKIPVY